jgi:hypothetical protein
MILSIRELRIVGSRRVMAEPATVDNEAKALALNEEIGEVVSVGIRFGKIMLDLVVSVRSVRRADNAFSASSSVLSKLKR